MNLDKEAMKYLEENSKKSKDNYNPLVTYYFVNKTLKMSSGKLGVQTARAGQVMLYKESCLEDSLVMKSLMELYKNPFMAGNKSICLKANSNQMDRLLNGDLNTTVKELETKLNYPIRLYPVYDIGATEVPSNSLTVIGMTPVYMKDIQHITKKFQLL